MKKCNRRIDGRKIKIVGDKERIVRERKVRHGKGRIDRGKKG